MPPTQGQPALKQPLQGQLQPDTLVLINSNNHLEGLGLEVLLPPSSTPAKCLGYCPDWLPKRKVAPHLAATAAFWPLLVFPLPLSTLSYIWAFVYTLSLQKPERPDSLCGWARGSEWRCPHSLCRVKATFQNRITICLLFFRPQCKVPLVSIPSPSYIVQ